MSGKLSGKVAIVTGGVEYKPQPAPKLSFHPDYVLGQGFGKGIASKFVAEGAKVVIADFKTELGEATAKELDCAFHLTDVTKLDDWEALLKKAVDTYGKVDVVINNAGTTYRNKSTNDVVDADFDLCFNVNVRSIFYSAKVIVPYMQKEGNGGVFVNIASTAGLRPRPGLTWYNASKAAVINATKTMAVEYAKDNIRWLSVCPVVALGTGLTELFLGKPENEKPFIATVPMGRGATPSDIANTCCFLASEEAAFLTGNAIEVDGGRCV